MAAGADPNLPFARIDMPPLDGAPVYEIWSTDALVHYDRQDDFALALTGDLMFGAIQLAEPPDLALEGLVFDLYDRLFKLIESRGRRYLLRIWNYFPGITEERGGLERYRRFTLGRYEAYEKHGRQVEAAPAACALGSQSGPLTLLFLSATTPGTPLENPRQVSAYRYPDRYGPRSPTFSRALLAPLGGDPALFISGTASIVGHESRHLGDPAAQAAEAMSNIRTLIAEARKAGRPEAGRLLLKTYVRDPATLPLVRPVIERELSARDRVIYLHAEICRPELLVEIEGTCL